MYGKPGGLDPRLTASQHHLIEACSSPLTGRGAKPKPQGQTRQLGTSGPLPWEGKWVGMFPGLQKPHANGSKQKPRGQAALVARARWPRMGSAPAPAFESKTSKKIVLGEMNSLYSQHRRENYIQASGTNGKNKSLI